MFIEQMEIGVSLKLVAQLAEQGVPAMLVALDIAGL